MMTEYVLYNFLTDTMTVISGEVLVKWCFVENNQGTTIKKVNVFAAIGLHIASDCYEWLGAL